MRDFNRERPPVNEEFGNDFAKTMPYFATTSNPLMPLRLKIDKALAIPGWTRPKILTQFGLVAIGIHR